MAAIEPPNDDSIWLGEYLAVLRRRKWSIILVTLLVVLGALLYGREQTPIYESTARVNATTVLNTGGQGAQAPNMETEQAFVTSDGVTKCAQLIMADGAFRADPTKAPDLDTICSDDNLAATKLDRSLQQNVIITTAAPATVMTIAYDSPNPHAAQGGAQAFALSYMRARTIEATAELNQLRAPLLDEEETLNTKIGKYSERINQKTIESAQAAADGETSKVIAIGQKIQDLTGKRQAADGRLSSVEQSLQALDPSKLNPPQLLLPAGLPVEPISPNMILIGALGVLAGLAIGIALAFLRERLDDSLRGRLDLETNLGAPVLAVIPKVPGWRNKHDARLVSREQPKSAVAEAYRTLRTSISFISAQRGLKVIMVCSPAAGEGKTTTAANLSMVLADAGKRVVLVSADLRKPRIHRFFGLPNDVGLSSVLAEEVQPWEAILDPGVENLRVLLSGPVPGRPAELLQSEQMGEVLTGLRDVADYIVIDTAPILLVADALALGPLADGVLFVADSDKTSRSAVAHAREQLEQVGAVVIGSVLNNFDPAKARAYRYYGYYSPYRYRYGRYGYGAYGSAYAEAYENGEGRRPVMELPQERRNS